MADMLSDVVCQDAHLPDHEMKDNETAHEQTDAAQNTRNVEQEAGPRREQQWEKLTIQLAEK